MSIDRTYIDKSAMTAAGVSVEEGYDYKHFDWMRTHCDVVYIASLLHARIPHDTRYHAMCVAFFTRAERLGYLQHSRGVLAGTV